MADIFRTILFEPLYNGLIFFVDIVPGADLGLAVIALTIVVRFILFPLSLKAVRTQMVMRTLVPKLEEIKEKFKSDRQEQAKRTMALYKEAGVNPFASILLLFIQLPIIIALYWVFFKGGLPDINTDILYSFIEVPDTVVMDFLGLIDISGRSVMLAVSAGATQFFQARLSLPPLGPRKENATMKDDFARSFQMQMKYVLPFVVGIVAYTISAAVALYWTTSNLFTIGQELYVRRRYKTKDEQTAE